MNSNAPFSTCIIRVGKGALLYPTDLLVFRQIAPAFSRLQCLSNSLDSPLDDVVLGLSADIHKMCAVSCHTNDDFRIFLRVFLCRPQGLIRYHIELHMIQTEIGPCPHIGLP